MEPVETIVLYKLYKSVDLNQNNLDAAGIRMTVDEAIIFMAQVDMKVQETINNVMLKRKRYKYKRINGKQTRVPA